jgi:NAD-dependent deacetylase
LLCTECDARFAAAERIADYRGKLELPPTCPSCAGVLRPDVVLFGEMLPDRVLAGLAEMQRTRFDLIFSVGTSAIFGYISHFIYDAQTKGVPCVEINPGETEVSGDCSHRIRSGAAAALSAILAARPSGSA